MTCNFLITILSLICSTTSIILPLGVSPDTAFYYVTLTLGDQPLKLFIDTGSPQTWVATNTTRCYGTQGTRVACSLHFGTLYHQSSTFNYLNDTSNSTVIQYADGSEVRGAFGFEDLVLDDYLISQMRMILAEVSLETTGGLWPSAGLLGLGPQPADEDDSSSPDATGPPSPKGLQSLSRPFSLGRPHYALNSPQLASTSTGNEFLPSIWSQAGLPAFFGLALSRTDSINTSTTSSGRNSSFAGILTIGEAAPLTNSAINASASNTFARIPLEQEASYYYPDVYEYRHDKINASGIVIGRDPLTASAYPFIQDGFASPQTGLGGTDMGFIVDSGSQLNMIPALHAALVNSLFEPPATLYGEGLWLVDCDAKAPEVGILIADEMFPINTEDMIESFELENRTTICTSTLRGASVDEGVLGMPFLRNVYMEVYRAEYDGQYAATMWLASREFYETY